MLPITALYTAILALLMAFLAFKTASTRGKEKVNLGTGDSPAMEKSVRAFGNFIEYVPMIILLMALHELQGMSENFLHAMGAATVAARILHAMGITDTMPALKGRLLGASMTLLILIIGGGYLLYNNVM